MFIIMSTSREEMVTSMEEILVAFKHMQQENQVLSESITHFQSAQASMSLGCVLTTPSQVKEP